VSEGGPIDADVVDSEVVETEVVDPEPDRPPATPLLEPGDGLPPVVTEPTALAHTVAGFAAGTGPVAVDAERASGYRYGQRAYLVQLRRAGAGTALVDPIGVPDLSTLGEALSDTEWVFHAASQDLACLADVGLHPPRIFDTELGARLAGHARVGLGPLVEEVLGLALEKGHSAADWSTRPLPEPWLRYAALDVEVLVELRDALHAELSEQGKLDWALEEFDAVLHAPPPPPRVDPWRRTSGLHRVRGARGLAMVRALWEARDALSRQRDTAPGRVLPDSAIVEAALAKPKTIEALVVVPGFTGRGARRHADLWFDALTEAYLLPDSALPPLTLHSDAPPPARSWADRDPEAATRLAACRTAVAAIADEHRLPVENLLSPDSVRRLCWTPPDDLDEATIAAFLREHGARNWQVALTAPVLAAALRRVRDQPA
jgi:ribonuclease D